MAPQLIEDEIDDIMYLARTGESADLMETVLALAEREKVPPATILTTAKDEGKSTALHMATGNGHLETVRRLVEAFEGRPKAEKQAFIDEANSHGNTGLHWAALGGHMETVKLLLEQGASPAQANEQNYVPLDMAHFNDKADVAEYLLSLSERLESSNGESGLADAVQSMELDQGQGEGAAEAG